MCHKFTEQQRAEQGLERAQWHTPSAAPTSARETPSRLLLLDTSTGLLVTITPWPFKPKCPQIQIYGSVFQGILLDWWDSIATFPGANFMGGCRSSQRLIPIPPSPYLSLSNQGIVLLPILSLPFSTCPTCSTSLTCSLGLIRNSYSLPGNVVY